MEEAPVPAVFAGCKESEQGALCINTDNKDPYDLWQPEAKGHTPP